MYIKINKRKAYEKLALKENNMWLNVFEKGTGHNTGIDFKK